MNILSGLTNSLGSVIGIKNEFLLLIILSILVLIVLKIINKAIIKIFSKKFLNSRDLFKFSQRVNLITNIICVIGVFILWEDHLNNVVTIISFISAGATIALREVILNLFAGIYIKAAKPFIVEDRISIGDDVKGDVVLITALSFKVLEITNGGSGSQSTGVIINVPNSMIFSSSLKNASTAFKYIWSELVIPIPIDGDIEKSKEVLYEIINKNVIINSTPKKMNKAIGEASASYRIYYNNLRPIIYTTFNENHIDLSIRFLVHPKKERTVIDELWIDILNANKEEKLMLYLKNSL
ncbi:MAG: mechanosensitive ion channel family protein [Bacilli bacterium]